MSKIVNKLQKYAVYAFMFSLNFETINLFNLNVDYLATKITVMILLITSVLSHKSFLAVGPFSKYLKPLIVFFILLSCRSYLNRTQQFNEFLDIPLFLNIVVLIILLNLSSRRNKILLNGMFLFSIGTFLLSIFYFFGYSVSVADNRITVFEISPNLLGIMASVSFFLLVNRMMNGNEQLGIRYLLILSLPLLFVMLVGTGSRVAIISFILGLFLFLFYNGSLSKERKFTLIFFTLVIFTFSWMVFLRNSIIIDRLRDSIYSGDISSRDYIWESLLGIISNNLIWGVGRTGYMLEITNTLGNITSPHNVLIEILCYTGIVGLIVFLLFLFRVLQKAINEFKKRNDIFPLILLVHIFGMILSGQIFDAKVVWVVLAFIIAVDPNGTKIVVRNKHL